MFLKAGKNIYNIDKYESLKFKRSCRNVERKDWELIVEVHANDKLLISVVVADLLVDVGELNLGSEWNYNTMTIYMGRARLNGCESSSKEVNGMLYDFKEDLWTFFKEDTDRSESCLMEYIWDCIKNNINVDLDQTYKCIAGEE